MFFGADCGKPRISSTKSLTGHGLSLASGMEAAFCNLGIKEGFMPGSAGIEELDPATDGIRVLTETEEKAPNIVLSNSSGFGGANVALLFKKI